MQARARCSVLTLSRKSFIWEWFWTVILELLCTLFAEDKVSRDVWKLLGFWIDFWCILDPKNGSKINEKSILGLILGQDGSKEVSPWANMAPRTGFWMIFKWPFIDVWYQNDVQDGEKTIWQRLFCFVPRDPSYDVNHGKFFTHTQSLCFWHFEIFPWKTKTWMMIS